MWGIFPKYLFILIAMSLLYNYYKNPKWADWRWFTMIIFIVLSFIVLLYNRFYTGFNLGFGTDILLLILYIVILIVYAIPFKQPEDLESGFRGTLHKTIPVVSIFMIVISVVILLFYIGQFIPVVNVVAIPIMMILEKIF